MLYDSSVSVKIIDYVYIYTDIYTMCPGAK